MSLSNDALIALPKALGASAGQEVIAALNLGTPGVTTGVANGGSGLTTLTPYAVLCGGTTGQGNEQQVSGLGTSGKVLTSNGPGALPTWQAPTGPSNGAVTDANNAFSVLQGFAAGLQNTPFEAALSAAFTDAVGTLTATNLSVTVAGGRSYRIEAYLIVSNSTEADGAKFDFTGGSASATLFDVSASCVGSAVAGTVVGTDLGQTLNYTTVTGTDRIWVKGYIKVNAGGSLQLRAATNTTVSGTMTLAAGSYLAVYDTVRK